MADRTRVNEDKIKKDDEIIQPVRRLQLWLA